MLKILFCGASGYGNIGDDSYKILFSEIMGEGYECHFDSPYPDVVCVPDMDAVVIGGGGLIYDDNTAHFNYMKMYMDAALENNKPLYFVSCGVQLFDPDNREWADLAFEQLQRWIPYLKIAKFISVRSAQDQFLLDTICDGEINITSSPDLAYLIKPAKYHLIQPGSYVFIPTKAEYENPLFQKELAAAKKDTSRRLYFVSFSQEDNEVVKELSAKVDERGGFNYRINLTPNEAASIVKDAYRVVTSRFHGSVFAHAMGLKDDQIVIVGTRYKDKTYQNPHGSFHLASHHIELLKIELNDLK